MLVSTAATSYVGLHRFCRMSKHNSPVAYTLGWNIWLMNLTAGGLLGYCSSKCITRRNVPSSKGVSAGPIITAFLRGQDGRLAGALGPFGSGIKTRLLTYQVMTLSGTGDAETPAGGSVCMRCCGNRQHQPSSWVATGRLGRRTLKSRMRRLLAAVDMTAARDRIGCSFGNGCVCGL